MKYLISFVAVLVLVAGGWFYLNSQSAGTSQIPYIPAADNNDYGATPANTDNSYNNYQAPSQPAPAPTPTTQTPPKTTPTPAPVTTPAPAPTVQTPPAAPAPVSVSISNFAFGPAQITVKVGTKVTWKNNDSAPHTVTSTTGAFGSETLNAGGAFSFVFNTPGTFGYLCNFHPSMKATVIVTP